MAHCRYSCVQYTPAVMSCDVQCGVVSTWCIRRRRHPLMSPCFLLLYGISNLLDELCAVRYSVLRGLCSDGAVARISDNFLYRCQDHEEAPDQPEFLKLGQFQLPPQVTVSAKHTQMLFDTVVSVCHEIATCVLIT